MRLMPARTGLLYSPSGTHTAEPYDITRYKTLIPDQNLDASRNQLARLLTLRSQERLSRMRTLQANWDGYGSLAPLTESIANAEARLPELYRLSTLDGVWREPHISASESGEISFEWWSADRKVTMYFGAETVELLRVWGTNIDSEMSLEQLPDLDAFPAIWTWLYGN